MKSNSWNSEDLLLRALLAHAVFWMLWIQPIREANNSQCSTTTVRALKQEENTIFFFAKHKMWQHRTSVFIKIDLNFLISLICCLKQTEGHFLTVLNYYSRDCYMFMNSMAIVFQILSVDIIELCFKQTE